MSAPDVQDAHLKPTGAVRRFDLFEAVKYDIRLHGPRFIILEFGLVAVGALALAIMELLHAANGAPPLLGGIWFVSFALNCLAVVVLALCVRRIGTGTVHSDRRLHLYVLQLVVLLLIPLGVALTVLVQWRRGDPDAG